RTTPPHPYPHPLSLHDALPISSGGTKATAFSAAARSRSAQAQRSDRKATPRAASGLLSATDSSSFRHAATSPFSQKAFQPRAPRSEEHTSELQSRENLVCRLLL